jgi:hydrogenase maturation protease
MSTTLVDKVAEAVLYEGYILYPYRAASRKNRGRFTFGRVYPRVYSDGQHGAEPCVMQTQCLVRVAGEKPLLSGRIRFLHAMAREVCAAAGRSEPEQCPVVPELRIGNRIFQTWHEAVDREVRLPEMRLDAAGARMMEFSFPSSRRVEPLQQEDGTVAGFVRRRQHGLAGEIAVAAEPMDAGVAKITVRIINTTPMTEAELLENNEVLLGTLASAHTILQARGAEFLSLTDPPADCALATTACENIGTWPVLVGDEEKQERDAMLSSPIILHDYPKIARESAGDLCDGLEIDEILNLRVMPMTDEEKSEMRNVDGYARRILERTESLREDDLMKMHGTMRGLSFPGADFFEETTRLNHVETDGASLQAGDRVRINPRSRADAMDMMLAGKVGLIEAIEQDAEGRVHLAIVLEEDPGRGLGMMRQPGHRFFYGVDEVEPLKEAE